MTGLTYRTLKDALNELTEEQLDMTATVSTGELEDLRTEFFAITNLSLITEADDVLDENHPVLISCIEGDFSV